MNYKYCPISVSADVRVLISQPGVVCSNRCQQMAEALLQVIIPHSVASDCI